VTIVALSRLVGEAQVAAEQLAEEGIEAEIIDPRTLTPLDLETIVESVERTGRVVVAHEAVRVGGFGAELVARIQTAAFEYLDAPVERVGAPFTPVPLSPPLEDAYRPSSEHVIAAVRVALGRAQREPHPFDPGVVSAPQR
jgi:pyruvate dehydrogenase E1 component beta subunit